MILLHDCSVDRWPEPGVVSIETADKFSLAGCNRNIHSRLARSVDAQQLHDIFRSQNRGGSSG